MKRLFVKALTNLFDMDKEDAIAVARTIEDAFDGRAEIEDMDIDKYMRSLFYELHRQKLLKLRREEIKDKGKMIRKFYWSFDYDGIRYGAVKTFREDPYSIYQRIPPKAWTNNRLYSS
ncbi:MAG: hypothetical protein QXS02_03025 [Candidatus Thermoplasmatota archaeon]